MRPNTGKQWHTSHSDHELMACRLEGRCGAVGVRALYIAHAQVYVCNTTWKLWVLSTVWPNVNQFINGSDIAALV